MSATAARMELLDDDWVALRVPYDAAAVEQLKTRLIQRRWDAKRRVWLVHLTELALAMELCGIAREQVPDALRRAYAERWRGGVVELRVGAAAVKLLGANLPVDELEALSSYDVPSARYAPAYQSGEWDGRRRLMRRDGGLELPIGLLERALALLQRLGRPLRLRDERQPPPALQPPPASSGPPLRPYQQEALAAALAAERGVLQLATGAGKTLLAAHLIARRAVPAVVLVHTRELLRQTARVFEEVLGEPIGLIGDGQAAPARITVATIQTAARAFGIGCVPDEEDSGSPGEDPLDLAAGDRARRIRECLKDAGLVIFDECHHLPSDTCFELSRRLRAYYRYGMSATPWRADGADLVIEAALGPTLARVDSSRLIAEGYLVAPTIVFLEVPPVEVGATWSYGRVYQRAVVRHEARNRLLAEAAQQEADAGRRVLVLVNHAAHLKRLQALLPAAAALTGRDSAERRAAALDALRSGTQRLLIATTLADEGLDLPALDVLVLAGAGRAETRALQRIGRVLRPAPGKTRATVYDCWDQTRLLAEHSARRKRIYETEPLFAIRMPGTLDPQPRQERLF